MWVSHSIIPSTGSSCSHFPNQHEATVGKRLIHWLLSPLLFVIHILMKIIIVITILLQLYSPWYPHIVSKCSVSLLYLHDIPIIFPCVSQNFPSTSPGLYTNPCDFPHVSQDFYMISTWYYHVPIIFPTCSHHFPMIFPRAFPRFSDFPAFSPHFPRNFHGISTPPLPAGHGTAWPRYLCSEELWGEDRLMEELLASKGLLQAAERWLKIILIHSYG